MSDTPPDRLSVNPASPFYDEAVLKREVGVRFKGVEKFNVEEYCVSERWIRVAAGAAKDRKGNPLTLKLAGDVEVWFKESEA
ncbi:MAG: DUF3297 family protein [Proteobacteria bacterium]|nr:DUF3297 family protein [Pseudomonadota bacterium]